MRIFLIVGGIMVLAVGMLVLIFFPSAKTQPGGASGPITFPSATSTAVGTPGSSQISLAGQTGSSVITKDFLHNGETAADVVNPGHYILAGSSGYCLADGTCPSGASTTDFAITYNEAIQFFNIVLLKEPLGAVRSEVEQFLEDRLGIAQSQACELNYFISVPDRVNTIFSGKNLGFSFCPGATQLPQ